MKKWLSIFLAFVITSSVLFGYNEFNGNFISKQIAKSTLKDYLSEHYPDADFQFDKGFYNFKFNAYTFDVTFYESPNNWTYTFEVGPKYLPNTIQTKTMHYDSRDETKSNDWSDQGSQYVKELLTAFPIGNIYYSIDVPNQFPQTEWAPAVNVIVAPSISIEFPLYKGETEEEFLNTVQEIQAALDRDEIRYDTVSVYMDEKMDNRDGKKEGYASIYYQRKYSLQFQGNSPITLDNIE
ncbi:hypothetical protein ACTHOQ_04355 [Solibacillus silvestris]|uniref:YfjL-like protein n=1 Tax=Solibacillus silvestris TaxID=76853 RepID=UPI003F7FFA7D